MKVLRYHLPLFLLGVILMVLAVAAVDTAYLTIELTSSKRNFIQVFWTGKDGKYLPEKSITYATRPGRSKYVFPLTDALFIHHVRVDLQNGKNGRIPRPIELHEMQIEFKGLYHRRDFDLSLSDFKTVEGIKVEQEEGSSEKIVFTSADPYIAFDLSVSPKYYQLILPLFVLFMLHFLLVFMFLRNRRESWLLDMVIPGGPTLPQGLMDTLRKKKIRSRLVVDKQWPEGRRIQLEVAGCGLSTLRSTLQESGCEIKNLKIVSLNGGEAGWRSVGNSQFSSSRG